MIIELHLVLVQIILFVSKSVVFSYSLKLFVNGEIRIKNMDANYTEI